MNITIAIIGLGFVGSAMYKSFSNKITEFGYESKYKIIGYDKYKQNDNNASINECLKSDIIFLSLPTVYDAQTKNYDISPLIEWCELLHNNIYRGIIVIKSTICIGTTNELSHKYQELTFAHNPEFLTARTAYEDFHNQKHIVLGISNNKKIEPVISFYQDLYKNADISICNCIDSESMKLYCNVFYAIKIQAFNELYLLSNKTGGNYDKIVNLMLKNGWINPMHTQVPGPDGKLSYGGLCFPKDTNALVQFMKKINTPHKVLEATISERNEMRNDQDNIK